MSRSDLFVRTYHRQADLPPAWADLQADDIFLQPAYLEALEKAPPKGMSFVYFLFYRGEEPIGLAYGQILRFDAARHLQGLEGPWWKKRVAALLRFPLLVAGNVLLTGQHAFFFRREADRAAELLDLALRREAEKQGIPALLIKDLPAVAPVRADLEARGYLRTQFQPNMVLKLDGGWESFGDYLGAMQSKYRVRARRALRRASGIQRRELDGEAIRAHQAKLFGLYREVAGQAEVNLLTLDRGYFSALAAAFPRRFRLVGYFRREELIGFRTTLRNGRELEAHFLGFRHRDAQRHDLYLNMLYDMVGEAVEGGAERLVLSRTALEIKSSIGAEPEPATVFLTSRMPWFNAVLPLLLRWLTPRSEWRQRHPFGRP